MKKKSPEPFPSVFNLTAARWMLRELGDRNLKVLYSFLDENVAMMPRTMLRYSIEKLSPEKRKPYMLR